jgi:hypothetical protein
MRAHAIRDYESILQVLSESGCPICAFLRNVQAKLLQEGEIEEFVTLCNSHAWALAAVRDSAAAAPIFHALIRQRSQSEHRECSVCIRLGQEETLRIQELLTSLGRRHVLEWIEQKGVLCLPHGTRMREDASESGRTLIDSILSRRHQELEKALGELMSGAGRGDSEHGGVLGKAAEYLVSQRGISLRPALAVHRR